MRDPRRMRTATPPPGFRFRSTRATQAIPDRFESMGIPKGLRMSECLDIDPPLRGWAMPRSYSGDLRERVIEVVEMEGDVAT